MEHLIRVAELEGTLSRIMDLLQNPDLSHDERNQKIKEVISEALDPHGVHA